MKIKTQHILTFGSIISLLAINYYVSSTDIKYRSSRSNFVEQTEDKKIDKVEMEEVKKEIKKKTYSQRKTNEVTMSVPSLFEMSQELGVPLIVSSPEEELTYPE